MNTAMIQFEVLEKHQTGIFFKDYSVTLRLIDDSIYRLRLNENDYFNKFFVGMSGQLKMMQHPNGSWTPYRT